MPAARTRTHEVEVHGLTLRFKAAADRAGVPVTLDAYGPGSHDWPYWQRDLQWVIGPVASIFAHPPAPPAHKAFMSADDPWSQWGYTVSIARPAREFSALRDGDRAGFVLAGSGTASVITPAQYTPGSRATVRMTGPHANRTMVVRVSRGPPAAAARPARVPATASSRTRPRRGPPAARASYATQVSISGGR